MKNEKIYFADTSFLIDLARGMEKAVSIIETSDAIVTSSLSIFELGKKARFDPEKIDQSVIDFSNTDAKKSSELFRDLSSNGEKINEIDYMIGAQALNQNLPLLTADKDFQKIPELETVYYREK